MTSIRETIGRKVFQASMGGLALLSLWGCFGERVAGTTGVGNPPQGEVIFAMVATKTPAAVAAGKRAADGASEGFALPNPGSPDTAADPADTAFTLTDRGGIRFTLRSAVANVGQVKFKLPAGLKCTEDIKQTCEVDDIKIVGPFVADLMAGTFTPAFPAFMAPVGAYQRVEIRLEALEPGAPSPVSALQGHSMVLSGTFAYGGRTDRAFSIILDFDEEATFDSGSMSVKVGTPNNLRLLFNVDEWLTQADIGRCLDEGKLGLDTLGNLLVDKENACSGLEKVLKDGVKASGDMGEDPKEEIEGE